MGTALLNTAAGEPLSREEAAEIVGCHERTIMRYEEKGQVWRIDTSNGDRRVQYDPRSIARLVGPDRLLKFRLRKLAERKQENASPEQPSLFARSEVDEQYEDLLRSGASDSQINGWRFKFDALQQVRRLIELGHSPGDARAAVAAQIDRSERAIQDWQKRHKEFGWKGLLDKPPGPARFSGTKCTPSLEGIVRECTLKGLSVVQTHELLLRQPDAQRVHRTTVGRWRKNLSPFVRAAKKGRDARKAACGYIDRSWEDCKAGEMWCMDEWLADFFVYDENNAQDFGRPHIVTLLDARSRCVLDFEVTLCYSHQTVLDIVERALRNHPRPDYFYSDKGGWFRGKLGRNFRVIPNEKIFGPAASSLEQIGVCRRGPREEKNPRANPVEPFNGYLADHAPELSTYCGSSADERPERIDAQLAEHDLYIRGKAKSTPLITLREGHGWTAQKVEGYNQTPSRANGLRGLSPAAAYRAFATDEDRERRRVDEGLIALAFSESFPGVTIRQGGVIELKGIKYSDPQLLLIQGERRDVRRARHDRNFIVVIPAHKGEEPVVARRRVPVGTHDPASLARECEILAATRKVVAESMMLPERSAAGARDERREISTKWDHGRQRAWSPELAEETPAEPTLRLVAEEQIAEPLPKPAPMTVEVVTERRVASERAARRLSDVEALVVEEETAAEPPLPGLHDVVRVAPEDFCVEEG